MCNTYLYQEMEGSGEPEALQDNVISSPLSAVALKDFWGIVIAGGTEKRHKHRLNRDEKHFINTIETSLELLSCCCHC